MEGGLKVGKVAEMDNLNIMDLWASSTYQGL